MERLAHYIIRNPFSVEKTRASEPELRHPVQSFTAPEGREHSSHPHAILSGHTAMNVIVGPPWSAIASSSSMALIVILPTMLSSWF